MDEINQAKGKTENGDNNIDATQMTEFCLLLSLEKSMMLSPEARKKKSFPAQQLEQINKTFTDVVAYLNSLQDTAQQIFCLRLLQFMMYQRSVIGVGQRCRLSFTFLFQKLSFHFPKSCLALLELVVSKYGSFADINRLAQIYMEEKKSEIVEQLASVYASQLRSDLKALLEPLEPSTLSHSDLLEELKKLLQIQKAGIRLSLAGKWLPRQGHANDRFRFFIIDALWGTDFSKQPPATSKRLNFYEKLYRVMCSSLNKHLNTVETLMCKKDFSSIDPGHVPSVALTKMRKAFLNELVKRRVDDQFDSTGNRHPGDEDRVTCRQKFREYMASKRVKAAAQDLHNLAKLIFKDIDIPFNAEDVFSPEELAEMDLGALGLARMSTAEKELINNQWNTLKYEMEKVITASENGRHVLPVIDVSGSMSAAQVMDIAIGLGVLCSQLSSIPNHFITFHETPSVVRFDPNDDVFSVFKAVKASSWGESTNIDACCELLLKLLTDTNVPTDYVFTILILTDGQFDQLVVDDSTFYERMKGRFEAAGYPLPRIVFWNLNATAPGFPVSGKEQGVQMVSGYSQSLLKQVLSQDFTLETVKNLTPEQTLREALESFVDVEETVLQVGEGIFGK
ncbi:hypothetical protein GEMRC1_011304 [Eukaryota sp. GEM-RC1]